MRIVFVSSGQYPNGGAATNRHLAYAKGLKELGHEVIFLLLKKQQWEDKVLVESGIEFKSVCSVNGKRNSKIGKVKSYWDRVTQFKRGISNETEAGKISAFVLLDPDIQVLIPLIRQIKGLGIRIFHERTEYPFVVGGNTIRDKINRFIYLNYVVKKFDGIFVINHALKKYFSGKTKGKVPVVIINMVVDPTRFECNSKTTNKDPVIAYCGSMDGDKDGVPILINAFARISEDFPDIKLRLIGSLDDEETKNHIESLMNSLNIREKVILTGQVNRTEMPELLCNSEILALARPNNKQAEGGFPTKLGEYLATGRVVVITNVGEVGAFLKDGINAFISEPDSALKFSEKLREALLSGNRISIGLEGKKLVYNEFNYLTQARVMEEVFSKS